MQNRRVFLIVCDDTDRLMLLSSVLHRVFPNAVVQTCRDLEPALSILHETTPDAVVSCRATATDPIPLVELLRSATAAPIIAVSGEDDGQKVLLAGASHFLAADRWLLIGKKVAAAIDGLPRRPT